MLSLTRQQAQQIDSRAMNEYGLAGAVLMENAGRGAADLLVGLGAVSPVVVCCGKGNNGGDGFVIARHLDLAGIDVRIVLFADPDKLPGDALTNFRIAEKSGLRCEHFGDALQTGRFEAALNGANWIVDALLGTGAGGAPRSPLDVVIERINQHPAPILAIDIPSGLDCDTGVAAGAAVRAVHTCTFVANKRGFENEIASQYTGEIHIVGIGAPRKLVEEFLNGGV